MGKVLNTQQGIGRIRERWRGEGERGERDRTEREKRREEEWEMWEGKRPVRRDSERGHT